MPLEFCFISHWTKNPIIMNQDSSHVQPHDQVPIAWTWLSRTTGSKWVGSNSEGRLFGSDREEWGKSFTGRTQILHRCCSSHYRMHLTNVGPLNREINSHSNCRIGIVKTKKKRFSRGCEQRAALDESLSGGDEFASVPTGGFSLKTLTHHYWPQGLVLTPPTNKRPLADDDWLNWEKTGEKKQHIFDWPANFMGFLLHGCMWNISQKAWGNISRVLRLHFGVRGKRASNLQGVLL